MPTDIVKWPQRTGVERRIVGHRVTGSWKPYSNGTLSVFHDCGMGHGQLP
jgi:hypothetical protein